MTADRWAVPPGLRRKMVEAARQLRRQQTRAEDVLWAALRNRQLDGLKFRRQQPIGPTVVDFFAPSARLVVEVDGTVHDDPAQRWADQERQRLLESLGLHVLRVRSEAVERDLAGVLGAIREAALSPRPSQALTPGPSPGALTPGPSPGALTPGPSPKMGEGGLMGDGELWERGE